MSDRKDHPYLASFGRRRSRQLKPAQVKLKQGLLPKILIASADIKSELAGKHSVWLEIGFGGGEHLAYQAGENPETLFIGSEVYENGVVSLLQHIEREKLTNIRIFPEDFRTLMPQLPENSVERAFILFPDPWPKTRHHKRRLIQQPFLSDLHGILKKGAFLHLATDWQDYADWMLVHLMEHPGFSWTAEKPADWQNPPSHHFATRYQKKAENAGRSAVFLNFIAKK